MDPDRRAPSRHHRVLGRRLALDRHTLFTPGVGGANLYARRSRDRCPNKTRAIAKWKIFSYQQVASLGSTETVARSWWMTRTHCSAVPACPGRAALRAPAPITTAAPRAGPSRAHGNRLALDRRTGGHHRHDGCCRPARARTGSPPAPGAPGAGATAPPRRMAFAVAGAAGCAAGAPPRAWPMAGPRVARSATHRPAIDRRG